MLKDITFGQYYPTESFVHKMDSRVKILLTILYIVGIFFIKSFTGFVIIGVCLLLSILLSRVPIKSILKSIKAIMFLIVFTAVLNIFFYTKNEVNVLWSWGIITISSQALISTGLLALRLVFLVIGSSLLMLTTTPVALTDGIESLLAPFKLIKLPVHELALIMSITLRFIPSLAEETDRIMSAQKARGADFESGNLFRRAKSLVSILIPLLVGAFKRAEELSDAMEARCYKGAKGRTKMKRLSISYRDIVGVLFMVAFFMMVLVDRFVFLSILI